MTTFNWVMIDGETGKPGRSAVGYHMAEIRRYIATAGYQCKPPMHLTDDATGVVEPQELVHRTTGHEARILVTENQPAQSHPVGKILWEVKDKITGERVGGGITVSMLDIHDSLMDLGYFFRPATRMTEVNTSYGVVEGQKLIHHATGREATVTLTTVPPRPKENDMKRKKHKDPGKSLVHPQRSIKAHLEIHRNGELYAKLVWRGSWFGPRDNEVVTLTATEIKLVQDAATRLRELLNKSAEVASVLNSDLQITFTSDTP